MLGISSFLISVFIFCCKGKVLSFGLLDINILKHILFVVYSSGKFTIITFEEYIAIALDAPRVVGIYPEIKNPVFINEHVSYFSLKSTTKNDCAGNYWLL